MSAAAKPWLVLGAGGHAKVLLDILCREHQGRVLGCLDPDARLWGKKLGKAKVLGGDDNLIAHSPDSVHLVNAVGASKDVTVRRRLFCELAARGYTFAAIRATSARCAADVVLSEGSQVLTNAVVNPGSTIGRNAVINTAAVIEHDCVVGDHAFVGPGTVVCGGCEIGEAAFLGAHVTVLPGVRVGAGARVMAGAIIHRDIPAEAVALCAPAKLLVQEKTR